MATLTHRITTTHSSSKPFKYNKLRNHRRSWNHEPTHSTLFQFIQNWTAKFRNLFIHLRAEAIEEPVRVNFEVISSIHVQFKTQGFTLPLSQNLLLVFMLSRPTLLLNTCNNINNGGGDGEDW
ncbi:unnamed protein product [Trifolium pratense]|uniref:Uncharacterized protein n=1 Tax=Trifolium pratense TaxID=57577 RepID=A0ACB0LUT4_TRIPR|nr:unnamed protein product [Trifolium pratense]